jgi:tetratricopeptide (TPR) repeat protein
MNGWLAERAQSHIFIGEAMEKIGANSSDVIMPFITAMLLDRTRREPLIKLADYFFRKNEPAFCMTYALASLSIGKNNFYANDMSNYREVPHEYLYWAYSNMNRFEEAKKHYDIALGMAPHKPRILNDKVYFYK